MPHLIRSGLVSLVTLGMLSTAFAVDNAPTDPNAAKAKAQSQAASKDAKKMTPEMQANMKAWEEAAKTGEMHKMLAEKAGKWNYTSRWWEGDSTTPEASKGTTSFKMLLGGRFLQQELKGKAMGKNFNGIGIVGYDNVTKKFDSVWMDDMGTGIMKGTGTFDAATKTMKEEGQHSDPTAPNQMRKFRSEWTFADKNTMTYKMWTENMDGSQPRRMEITYQRAGTSPKKTTPAE